MEIKDLLICPRCKGELDDNCRCTKCGKQYESRFGIYNVLYEDLGEEYKFSDWFFDEKDFQRNVEEYSALRAEYQRCLSRECIDAEKKQDMVIRSLVEKCSGTVLDLATGRGMFLKKIMEWNPALKVIGSDIDCRILAVTKVVRECGANVAFLGTDGRHIALKDGSVDHVVSFVGLANMPETERVISEIHRVLKKNGTFIYKGAFLDPGSRSYNDLKTRFNLAHVMDIDLLTSMFEEDGFAVERSEIVARGVWAENPYDMYPFAGDYNNYGVIEVRND